MPTIIKVGKFLVEIENWDEFRDKLLKLIAIQIQEEIQNKAEDMGLFVTGEVINNYLAFAEGDEIIITNTGPTVSTKHGELSIALLLEYGTLDYWKTFGVDNFPARPDRKKKDMTPKQREQFRKAGKKGMQPFAIVRRTLFNRATMERIIKRAVRNA